MKILLTFALLFSVAFAQTEKVYFSGNVADTTFNFSLTDDFKWSLSVENDSVTVGGSGYWPKFWLFYKCKNCTHYDTLITDSARALHELKVFKYDYNSVQDYRFTIQKDSATFGRMKVVVTKFK
jgi:hypothetical protein